MDKALEQKFVEKFIAKDKKERLLYELNSSKKRQNAISRFAARLSEMVEARTVVFYGNKMEQDAAERRLKELTNTDECYFLTDDRNLSCCMNLHECLDKYYYYGPSIFICDEKAVLIVAEQEFGAPEKIILFSD